MKIGAARKLYINQNIATDPHCGIPYKKWWLQHIPHQDSQDSQLNWWRYIFFASSDPNATPIYSITPTETSTPTSTETLTPTITPTPTATPTLASNNGYFLSPEYDFSVSNNGNQYGYYVLDFPQPNAQFVGYFLWTSHNISFLENIPLIDPNVPNVILGGSSIFGHGSNWYCYGIETGASIRIGNIKPNIWEYTADVFK